METTSKTDDPEEFIMSSMAYATDESIETLHIEEFAKLLGTDTNDIQDKCEELLRTYDFSYAVMQTDKYENTLLEVLKVIDSANLSVSGEERKKDWELGWSENLTRFVGNNYDISALIPRYMHKFRGRRLFSQYVHALDDNFEVNFYTVYRHYLFKKYLRDYDYVYEFGCGTGYNLVIMGELFPEKRLIGLDWADSSVELVNKIASVYNSNLSGHNFDYYDPDYDLDIPGNSAFITLNSMEQLGTNYHSFLKFILKKKPAICVNSEPILELYDQNNLLDYLAIRYHTTRNYLNGYLHALEEMNRAGRIELLKVQRVRFGNLFHDGYSFVVWKII